MIQVNDYVLKDCIETDLTNDACHCEKCGSLNGLFFECVRVGKTNDIEDCVYILCRDCQPIDCWFGLYGILHDRKTTYTKEHILTLLEPLDEAFYSYVYAIEQSVKGGVK